jgi:hypothetical protein
LGDQPLNRVSSILFLNEKSVKLGRRLPKNTYNMLIKVDNCVELFPGYPESYPPHISCHHCPICLSYTC